MSLLYESLRELGKLKGMQTAPASSSFLVPPGKQAPLVNLRWAVAVGLALLLWLVYLYFAFFRPESGEDKPRQAPVSSLSSANTGGVSSATPSGSAGAFSTGRAYMASQNPSSVPGGNPPPAKAQNSLSGTSERAVEATSGQTATSASRTLPAFAGTGGKPVVSTSGLSFSPAPNPAGNAVGKSSPLVSGAMEARFSSQAARNEDIAMLQETLSAAWKGGDRETLDDALLKLKKRQGEKGFLYLKWSGMAAFGDKRFGDAQKYFTRALAVRPDDFECRYNLTMTLLSANSTAEAGRVFRELKKDHPFNPEVISLGNLLDDNASAENKSD